MIDGRPRLLVISQHYWPEAIGSAPFVTDLCEWFASRGNVVEVLAARPHYPGNVVRADYREGRRDGETRNGVQIRRVGTPSPATTGARGRAVVEGAVAAGMARRLLATRLDPADRALVFCPSALVVLAAGTLLRGAIRPVGVVHDIQSGLADGLGLTRLPILSRSIERVERRALNGCGRIIALTGQMREALIRLGVRRPVEVLPIWADTGRIRPAPFPDSSPVAMYAGNLGRKQGIAQLLAAAEQLAATSFEFRLVIRGDGALGAAVRARIEALATPKIRMEGLVAASRIGASLSEAHLHVVPQRAEGAAFAVPSKIFNILAAGRPILATAQRGSALSDLADLTGAIDCVPPDRPERLAAAMQALLEDRDRLEAMGRRGRRWVENNASRDIVLARYAAQLDLAVPH